MFDSGERTHKAASSCGLRSSAAAWLFTPAAGCCCICSCPSCGRLRRRCNCAAAMRQQQELQRKPSARQAQSKSAEWQRLQERQQTRCLRPALATVAAVR